MNAIHCGRDFFPQPSFDRLILLLKGSEAGADYFAGGSVCA